MWWGKGRDEAPKETKDQSQQSVEFNPDKLPEARKLPKDLQKLVDKADEDGSIFDDIVEG